MKCMSCGYEGPGFQIVTGNPPCCNAWTTRQCPECGYIDRHCEMDERDRMERQIKEMCGQIKEAIQRNDLETAFKLRQEAEELNDYIGLKEEGEFLASLAKEARQWKRNQAKVLFEDEG
ncbi:MAG: hypothetical protein DRG39_04885 [Deltaproteobacteria bacterium]|nr:MAG: hypothetical protein DRG39_04885 [Deltaproteobacteria bacterium]